MKEKIDNLPSLGNYLSSLLEQPKTESLVDCVFMDTEEGWKVSSPLTILVTPFSTGILPFNFNIASQIENLSDSEILSVTDTLMNSINQLINEDNANDETGFNIINANDLCNFFLLSNLYTDCLIEIRGKNIPFNILVAQKIYLRMISACINTIGLASTLHEWAKTNKKVEYLEIYYDFLEFLENFEQLVPVLFEFHKVLIFPEKSEALDSLLIEKPLDLENLQSEMILLFDFERELKLDKTQERSFCLHYIHRIFHALIKG